MRATPRSAGLGTVAGLLSIFWMAGCVGQVGESTGRDLPDGGSGGGAGSNIDILTGLGGNGAGTAGTGAGTGGADPGTGGASGGTIGSGSGGTGGDGGGAGSDPAGGGGSGGAAGTFGGGAGGSNGSAGRGGSTGAGGRGGSTAGTSGFAGRGGSTGAGGRGGTTGAGGSSAPDGGTGSDGGSVATFTDIYTNILVPHCSGSQCHNPGSQRGISFSSQTNAYNSVKPLVTPGNGANSSFYRTVNGGSMPPGGPKLSSTDLAKIKAWIDAGALNN